MKVGHRGELNVCWLAFKLTPSIKTDTLAHTLANTDVHQFEHTQGERKRERDSTGDRCHRRDAVTVLEGKLGRHDEVMFLVSMDKYD